LERFRQTDACPLSLRERVRVRVVCYIMIIAVRAVTRALILHSPGGRGF
jgi:hypothetical protein